MGKIQGKFAHIVIAFMMFCSVVLNFNFQANADIDQLAALANVVHSYDDDGLTKSDAGEPTQNISILLNDAEDPKLFLVSDRHFWANFATSDYFEISPTISLRSRELASNQQARAPPVII